MKEEEFIQNNSNNSNNSLNNKKSSRKHSINLNLFKNSSFSSNHSQSSYETDDHFTNDDDDYFTDDDLSDIENYEFDVSFRFFMLDLFYSN